ncbi:MAG: hypothetical protein KGH71_04190 [Candidatus Micrarchaeota archaeon]|nr:hypothetical protein [Candidatus Micrarchaeota archaeon]
MNYYAYLRRRKVEVTLIRFKFQKLFSFLHYGDFDKVQSLLTEVEQILKKYETAA